MEHASAANRVFLKRTRRGAVKTHVRQTYLRDDLPTGAPQLDGPDLEPKLSEGAERYYVLDTNVVLHQIDLLERPALTDVIVLQTVLDEVRHNKLSVYKRLRSIIADEQRRFHVFCNEFHRETFVARRPGESPNDRNDRAIRVATQWYQSQLGEEAGVEVLLLTNDAENRRLARDAGLKCESIHEHVRARADAAELMDVLASAPADGGGGGGGGGGGSREESGGGGGGGGGKREKGAVRYVAHLPLSQLQAGLTAGELHQGKLNISRHNSRQGAVFVSSLKGHTSILLRGDEALNRAIDGDIVAVRLLPEAEWTDQVDSKLADRAALAAADDDEEDGAGERDMGAMPFAADLETAVETGWGDDQTELASMGSAGAAAPNGCGGGGSGGGGPGSSAPSSGARAGSRGKRACGVVVGVVKRGWRPYVCVLDPESGLGGNYLAEPLDQRIPRINIRRVPHQWAH